MKKESKSLDNVKGAKVDTDKVHGGKMDQRDDMKELDINDFAKDIAIKRGKMSKGEGAK